MEFLNTQPHSAIGRIYTGAWSISLSERKSMRFEYENSPAKNRDETIIIAKIAPYIPNLGINNKFSARMQIAIAKE